MKKVLCVAMLAVLALLSACSSQKKITLQPGELGHAYYYDFKVNDAYVVDQENINYVPAEGNRLIAIDLTVTNTLEAEFSMTVDDFFIVHKKYDGIIQAIDPCGYEKQITLPYPIPAGQSVTGVLVFELPADVQQFHVDTMDFFGNKKLGNLYMVECDIGY